jgi:hypothetical protein
MKTFKQPLLLIAKGIVWRPIMLVVQENGDPQ